jgi:Zn-dependent metalloprotease
VPKLVYRVSLVADSENNDEIGFIDAQTGKLLLSEPKIIHFSATANFNSTRYNGQQQAITEYYNNNYNLADYSRGTTIHTWNLNRSENLGNRVEFQDADNTWTTAEYHANENDMALDIHWGLQNIYDYLLYNHGIDSYDGQGAPIIAYFKYGNNFYTINNAGWIKDDSALVFGDGVSSYYNPFASIDVIGHEFGHALTQSFIGWPYDAFEYGAFQEGLSDIWAAILEHRINVNSIWKFLDLVVDDQNFTCDRNMEDPDDPTALTIIADAYGTSTYYAGDQYVRSGVFSHWFYHLVNGGMDYDGVGIDIGESLIAEAEFGLFLAFTAGWGDIRQAILDAAEESLEYPTCSNVVRQIQDAWHEVGVGNPAPSYGVSISGDEILELDHTGNWQAQGWGGCSGNYYFEWYFNDVITPVGTGSTHETYFDDDSYEPQFIQFKCRIYDGETYTMSEPFYVQLIAHEPLSASISGDESVCLDTYSGVWSVNATGGIGQNIFEWYINEEKIDLPNPYFPHLYYYFNSGEWSSSMYNRIDLRVYDDETYFDAATFYFDLNLCLQMRDSIQVDPNPANDYIDISIVEYNQALSKATQINDNIKSKSLSPIEDKFYTYYIIDNYGKLVYQMKTLKKNIHIPVSGYIPGIYHVKVLSSKSSMSKQIIIAH